MPGGYYAPFYPYGYAGRTTVLQICSPPPPPPAVVIAPPLPRFDFVNEPVILPGQRVPLVEAPPISSLFWKLCAKQEPCALS